MHRAWLLLALLLPLASLAQEPAAATAAAELPGTVDLAEVVVEGLAEAETANVRAALGVARLSTLQRQGLRDARLRFLLRRAPEEVRRALEPFGYYASEVEVRQEPTARGLRVVVAVEAGEPVRVRSLEASIDGAAADDRFVMRELPKIALRVGDPLVHADYEQGKLRVDRKLAERGYFAASRDVSRVEVSREAGTADVRLHWASGPRYRMGEARFGENQLRPGLLDSLVDWEVGDTYHRNRLIRLQKRLVMLDYFALVEVAPGEDGADPETLQVPIDVLTTPAKRTTYSATFSVGTDTGVGVGGGLNRRWVNTRGHKWLAEAGVSQQRTSASTQYRVPALYRLPGLRQFPGWWSGEAAYVDENEEGAIGFERTSLRAGWKGLRDPWSLSADLYLVDELPRSRTRIVQDSTQLLYPELGAEYSVIDDRLWPTDALQGRGMLRFGVLDSREGRRSFVQAEVAAQWIRALGEGRRLILRGQLGATRIDSLDGFPPSLRFFAGGDRSVRGYGYRELGPRANDEVLGGRYLAVASTEFEWMIADPWGAAVFVDAGDVADAPGALSPKVGVGVGARWRSPVGPVGIDIAHGLDADAGGSLRLHISFGIAF